MTTQVVYFGEMQEPDVLTSDENGRLADLSERTERVLYVPPNEVVTIICAWHYFYFRIPITRLAREPSFMTRDPQAAPLPEISNIRILRDATDEKAWAVAFDVLAKDIDSWECNIGPEGTYYDQEMGRTYTHVRMSGFTLSTQQPIELAMEQLI